MLSMQLGHLRDLPHTITWSNISHPSHALMAPREMHAAACIGCHLIVFGGRVTGQEQVSDEVVTLCASHNTLKVISVDQVCVCCRQPCNKCEEEGASKSSPRTLCYAASNTKKS